LTGGVVFIYTRTSISKEWGWKRKVVSSGPIDFGSFLCNIFLECFLMTCRKCQINIFNSNLLWVIFVQSTLERWPCKVCKINTGSSEILMIFLLPFVLDVYATFPYDKRLRIWYCSMNAFHLYLVNDQIRLCLYK